MNEYVAFSRAEAMAIKPRPALLQREDSAALLTLIEAIVNTVHEDDRPLIQGHYKAVKDALNGISPGR